MAEGGEVLFRFLGDDGELQQTINGVQKALDSISTSSLDAIGDGFTKLGGVITGATGAIVGFGAKYNSEIESITMSLETLTGSSEEAERIMQQIKDDASKTPFDVRGLAKGNQMLISTGISADEAEKTILALGDAVSATGGGNDELTRMIANLQQIKNARKSHCNGHQTISICGY